MENVMEKILIIGGVAAGATAAAKARRISSSAHITMLEAGPDISFANCGLPYYIGGDIKSRSKLILQSPESFKEQYDVDVFTNTLVVSINRSAHTVRTVDSRSGEHKEFSYTKLILAQGGRPVTPTLPGADFKHVFTLWTLEDMDKITQHLTDNEPKTAVVVGGGFIGLEMVEALVKRGLKVHVVEMMPHVMSIMDAETAGFIQTELLSYGVGVHTNVGVSAIGKDSVTLADGTVLAAEMVLLSIGVRPTLQLAIDAGLSLGEAGGLLVDSHLRTSDADIYAAGDMIEIEHRVNGHKVRIPLAGPANRQGRIAAENALGGSHAYKGSLGTSVVRVFEAVAGTTGLSLKQALAAGIDADAVVVHKEHHTSYYPGAEQVTVSLVFDRKTGVVLGGQTAGYKGADKRLDVIAAAAASRLPIDELADIDFAYSPPIGTANDALNMAAYTAENKLSGFSPSVTVAQLDAALAEKPYVIVDVRDYFAFERNHVDSALHIPLELLTSQLADIPTGKRIFVYDEIGKKGHQALRTLKGAGFDDVVNISGGYVSMQRQASTVGFANLSLELLPIEHKVIGQEEENDEVAESAPVVNQKGPIVVDVRTPEEFHAGAVSGAVNIPLDELDDRYIEFGKDMARDITVYCTTGARSGYAQQVLAQLGYTNAKNGGGLTAMMSRKPAAKSAAPAPEGLLVVDVRTAGEFRGGAYPGSINISLDELPKQLNKLGGLSREIVVYCATGARSSYAQQFLAQNGFSNVRNGGGIMQMMRKK